MLQEPFLNQDYNPSSYSPIGQTTLVSGVLSNLALGRRSLHDIWKLRNRKLRPNPLRPPGNNQHSRNKL